jgi:hypothetical protein
MAAASAITQAQKTTMPTRPRTVITSRHRIAACREHA